MLDKNKIFSLSMVMLLMTTMMALLFLHPGGGVAHVDGNPTRGGLTDYSESYNISFSKPTFYGTNDPYYTEDVDANDWDDIAIVVFLQSKNQYTKTSGTYKLNVAEMYNAAFIPLNGTKVSTGTQRTVLFEDVTAAWCGPCTGVIGAMDRLNHDDTYFPEKYIGIEYHASQNNDVYYTADSGSKGTFYNIQYFPTVIINGEDFSIGAPSSSGANDTNNDAAYKTRIDTAAKIAAPLSIEAVAGHDSSNAWVSFTITVEDSTFDNIMVDANVALIQDAHPRRHNAGNAARLGWILNDLSKFRIFDIDGTPPEITDISPAADSTISGVQEITFTATDVDAADEKITKKVEIREMGGDWATLGKTDGKYLWDTTMKSAGMYIYKDGDYEIRITATDYWDETATVTIPVTLMNPDPPYFLFDDATMKSEIGSSMNVQGTLNIYWEATDDEEDDGDLLVDLYYGRAGEAWVLIAEDIANTGVFAWDTLNPERIPDNDRYRLNAVVTDGDMMEDETSTNFEFAINNLDPPEIELEAPYEGQEMTGTGTIRWTATDNEDNKNDLLIDIELSSDGGENYLTLVNGAQNSGSYPFDTTYLSDGDNYVAKVSVKDLSATVVSVISPVFSIYNNDVPECSFIYPEDEDTITGEVEIVWYSIDEEDDKADMKYELYYMHSSGSSWEPLAVNEPNTGSFMLDTTELPDGDGIYHLKLVVKDSRGEYSGAQTIYVTVYNPDEPTISSPTGPADPVSSGSAKFSWYAEDPDPGETDNLKVYIYVSTDGTQWDPIAEGVDNEGSYNLDVSGLADGTYQVKVVISDGSEENLTAEHVFPGIVVNNPDAPTVSFTTAPSMSANVTGLISFAWNGEDEDGDELTYELQYRPFGEDTWMPIQDADGISTTAFVWNTSKLDTGDYEVRIIATDGSIKMLQGEEIIGPFQIWVEKEEDPDGGHSVIDPVDKPTNDDEKDYTAIWIGLAIVGVLFMIIIIAVLAILVVKRKQRDNEAFYNAPPGGLPPNQGSNMPLGGQTSDLPPAENASVTQGSLPPAAAPPAPPVTQPGQVPPPTPPMA